eukprot:2115018-Ditylum_brightwellii.AAC.1
MSAVFGNMSLSLNTDETKEVQTAMALLLSHCISATYTMPGVFDKIQAVNNLHIDTASNLTDE